jgi:acetate kinase
MLILVINSGSSSIKYQLFDIRNKKSIAKGKIERIGEVNSKIKNHEQAINLILKNLTHPKQGVIKSVKEISAVGHRVVHGGEEISKPVVINKRIIKIIRKYSELAPLHNPPALLGIKGTIKILSHIPQVAVFDTAFHQTIPPKAYLYALPINLYRKYGIRRYGFHGTSHNYVCLKATEILKKPLSKLKLITCHLGNGCSITAVKNGKSVDTSMGFTPLEGLVMGTRSGDIDPAIVFYLMEKENLSYKEVSELLNKKSGLLGLSGISNDMRDIISLVKKRDLRANLALEVFIYRLVKYIGAYILALSGVDAIVLTAGIGENQPEIKQQIRKYIKAALKHTRVPILIIPTNEELMIAQQTYEMIK